MDIYASYMMITQNLKDENECFHYSYCTAQQIHHPCMCAPACVTCWVSCITWQKLHTAKAAAHEQAHQFCTNAGLLQNKGQDALVMWIGLCYVTWIINLTKHAATLQLMLRNTTHKHNKALHTRYAKKVNKSLHWSTLLTHRAQVVNLQSEQHEHFSWKSLKL